MSSFVGEVERCFAENNLMRYGVAMNSGTATLHCALEAIGVRGREVIVPSLGPIMTAAAVIHAGGIPVFADVEEDTFTIDADDVQRKMNDRTAAIIGVSLYGLPADYPRLKALGVPVVEDNAQAVLSICRGQGVVGDIASYSFETTKHLSCGEGGMALTNNERYAELMRKYGGHGYASLTADRGGVMRGQVQSPSYIRHELLGWNYRMPEVCAEMLMDQLDRIDEIVGMRVSVGTLFRSVFEGSDMFRVQALPQGFTNTYYTAAAVFLGEWERFRDAYLDNGGDGIFGAWQVPYNEPPLREYAGQCPTAEWLQPRMMQFKTNYTDMRVAEKKVNALWKTIQEFE